MILLNVAPWTRSGMVSDTLRLKIGGQNRADKLYEVPATILLPANVYGTFMPH